MSNQYVPMNRLQMAQSLANERGWGVVIAVLEEVPGKEVRIDFEGGCRWLNGLLAYEILRRPETLNRKPGAFDKGQNTHAR